MNAIDLTGKRAMVTGGSSGIGRAVCSTLAEAGAAIVVADLTDQPREGGDPTHVLLGKQGVQAEYVALDVTNSAAVAKVVAEQFEGDGIDILVNNAGVLVEGAAVDTDDDSWHRQFAVNVDGTFFCSREVIRHLLAAGRPGKVVNISSISGFRGNPGFAAYCASKGAVANLTRQLGLDYAAHDINVNAVAPGFVTTEMTALYDQETRDLLAGQTPRGKWASAQDVANCVAFLASGLSDHVCGENLVVDGGWLVGTPV